MERFWGWLFVCAFAGCTLFLNKVGGMGVFCGVHSNVSRMMKQCPQSRWVGSRAGFTLVELMAVILVIAVLAGLVLGISGLATRKAADGRARTDLQVLRNALEEYRIDYGSYPGADDDVFQTEADWENEAPELTNLAENVTFVDPWGNVYRYEKQSRFAFDLYSLGPFGEEAEETTYIR
jgi:general secretion pathway protein G